MPTSQDIAGNDALTASRFPVTETGRGASSPKPAQFSSHIWRMMGCVIALAVAFALYARSEKDIGRANELRHRSFLLADELRQSSDDLTRMVRTYVVTGDPIYKQHYQDILDIRDGKKPRPEAYGRIYWDLVLIGGQAPRPESKQSIPLLELMLQAAFTEEEFRKLGRAKANSDAQTVPEFEAMKLVERAGPEAEANRAKARRMLYDANYHQAKAGIMKPLDEFNVLVDERTLAAIRTAEGTSAIFRYVFVAFGLGLMFTLWRIYAALSDTLGGSVDAVYAHIAKIGSGDFSAAIRVKEGPQGSVLAWLSEMQAKLNRSDHERKRTEKTLRESEQNFHQLADNITDAFWIRSPDMREVHYISPGFERIWGRSAESLYANPHQWADAIFPEDRERVLAAFATLMGAARNISIAYRIARPGGEIRWVQCRGFQARNAAGDLIRLTGVVTDITEGKSADAQRERLADIVEASPDFIGFADPKTTQIQYINKHGRTMCGIGEDEDIGRFRISDVHPAWMNKLFAEVILPTAVRDGSWEGEGAFLHRDGREIPVSMVLMARKAANGEVDIFYTVSRDISERKRAEQAAERTLQRLNEAQRIAQIGDWEWDIATQVITWSPQVFEIVGRDPSLGPPRDYVEQGKLYDAPSWTLMQEKVSRAIESGEPQNYELVVIRPDGVRVNAQAMAVPRKDESGRVVGISGTIQDITARKRSEDALRLSEERLRAALSASCTGTFRWDIRINEVSWDDSLNALFGLPPGRTARSLEAFIAAVHPEDRAGVIERCERCAREGADFAMEFRVLWPDGSLHWLDDRGKTFSDAAGQPLYMTGACVDITEAKQAEEALRTSEAEFRTLAEAMPQMVWTTRPDGWNTYFSQQWVDYTGLTLEESLGHGWNKPFHPEDQQRAWDAWQHATATIGTYSIECRLRRADGVYRWWLIRGVPMQGAAGHISKWFGTCTDIHDLKLAELEISRTNRALCALTAELSAAKEAAEAASRAKSEFLANMSHEIRTPMNGIIGMTELVLDTELDREQREYLGMAKSSAHALRGLINDILDFSKIEAGKLELETISFSLRDCIGTMLKPLGMRADQKALELTADIPADVPDHFIGDPMRLRQILINLTDNAIKFTNRGDVMLRVAVESATDDEQCLHFSIADTGIGIPAAKQALIFEAFAQADGSTTRTYGGTGLGLAIAWQLVRQMGGRIWVESKADEGTTFHFTISLPMRQTPIPGVRHADASELEGLRVLVADDNVVNRRILREMLTNWRMQPAVVASGAAAVVEMVRAANAGTPFRLVILDGMMPEMDGFMVAEKIREHAELSGATVMMLSSAMPSGVATRCAALGVASYLTKPVSQSELLDALLLALGGVAELDPVANPTPFVPAANGLRILLAEDNVINHALAAGILTKRGHSLVHAANGREAVEAAARETFDLIFMDVQMPEMDGFEATRRIRELEKPLGRHTPIAAMTAHAMAGDRERCLAAGMDDYISKPLQKAVLLALLERITKSSASSIPEATGQGPRTRTKQENEDDPPPAFPIFSREKLLDQLDGDEALMGRMIALFHENTPRLLEDIRGSIGRRGASDLARSAHALLSSLGAFGANSARQLTQQLEAQAHAENFEQTDRTFAALERETAEIHVALAGLNPTPNPALTLGTRR